MRCGGPTRCGDVNCGGDPRGRGDPVGGGNARQPCRRRRSSGDALGGDPMGRGDPVDNGDPMGSRDPMGEGDPLGGGDSVGGGDPMGCGDPLGGGDSVAAGGPLGGGDPVGGGDLIGGGDPMGGGLWIAWVVARLGAPDQRHGRARAPPARPRGARGRKYMHQQRAAAVTHPALTPPDGRPFLGTPPSCRWKAFQPHSSCCRVTAAPRRGRGASIKGAVGEPRCRQRPHAAWQAPLPTGGPRDERRPGTDASEAQPTTHRTPGRVAASPFSPLFPLILLPPARSLLLPRVRSSSLLPCPPPPTPPPSLPHPPLPPPSHNHRHHHHHPVSLLFLSRPSLPLHPPSPPN